MSETEREAADEARRKWDYDPATGLLLWKSPSKMGGTKVGSVAGTINKGGYVRLRFQGKFHNAHRLCWLHYYGCWPSALLDHINGDTKDNRISNLREVTTAQNQWNRVKPKGGVFWHKANQRWCVHLKVNGTLKYFGSFKDEQQAKLCATAAIKEHHGEFARA